MKVKTKIIKKIRKDNIMSLELCIRLDIQQAALFRRIDRGSKTLFNDMRLSQYLIDKGFSNEEIFETEPTHK